MNTQQPSVSELHIEKSIDLAHINADDLLTAIREEKENIEAYLREQISKAGDIENQHYVERILADILEKMADMAKSIDRMDADSDARQDAQSEYMHQKTFRVKAQKTPVQKTVLEEISPEVSGLAHAQDPFLVVNLMASQARGIDTLWHATARIGYSSLDSNNILFFLQILEGNNQNSQPKDEKQKSKKE